MKIILSLLPLLSVISPVTANLNSHNNKNDHSLIIRSTNENAWKKAVKTVTPAQIFQDFPILKTKYHWSPNEAKINAITFTFNKDGSLLGANLELVTIQKVFLTITYNSQKNYNYTDWKIKSLPAYTDDQLEWYSEAGFFFKSEGTDSRAVSYLLNSIAGYWNSTKQIAKTTPQKISWNYELINGYLSDPYSFLSETYSSILNTRMSHDKNGNVILNGVFHVLLEWHVQSNFLYIPWHATFNPQQPIFSYKTIKPNFSDWRWN